MDEAVRAIHCFLPRSSIVAGIPGVEKFGTASKTDTNLIGAEILLCEKEFVDKDEPDGWQL
jgi:hypothetical protein